MKAMMPRMMHLSSVYVPYYDMHAAAGFNMICKPQRINKNIYPYTYV